MRQIPCIILRTSDLLHFTFPSFPQSYFDSKNAAVGEQEMELMKL
jgi:hypothetical protein